MNISSQALASQYEKANADWPWIHEVNDSHGLPPFTMHALGSRETNLRNIVGDGGNGWGVWQRDIQHGIPDGWMEDVRGQCEWSANLLTSNLKQCGDLIGAANRYNSGSCKTSATTGKDYGPDVVARREWLEANIADLEHLHPVFRSRVIATGVAVASGARSTARQKELYDGWVARLPGYNPANPPGTSWHEYGNGIPGGVWALAVDFEEPYPHGAPGLIFPIAGEPWHAQPSEISEPSRVNGADSRLPVQPVVLSNKETSMQFTYIYNNEDFVWLGVERFHGHLPFGSALDGLKSSGQMADLGKRDAEFHKGVKTLADQLNFAGDA